MVNYLLCFGDGMLTVCLKKFKKDNNNNKPPNFHKLYWAPTRFIDTLVLHPHARWKQLIAQGYLQCI